MTHTFGLSKKNTWMLFWGIFGVVYLQAQVSISISLDREKYIAFEPIKINVSIKNLSGNTLSFGEEGNQKGYLVFQLKDLKGKPISKIDGNLHPSGNLILPPGMLKTISLSLESYFDVQRENDYAMQVRVGYQRFRYDFLSNTVLFLVRKGVRVWEQSIGIPDFNTADIIGTRTASLNLFHGEESDVYFFQIEDTEYVYTVHRLGPKVLGSNPQCYVDALSRIHTLIQIAPRLFHYQIFDLLGKARRSQLYTFIESLPELIYDAEVGSVTIRGGRIVRDGVDYGKPKEERITLSTSEEKPEKESGKKDRKP